MNANIMNRQILHLIKYDLKGHIRSLLYLEFHFYFLMELKGMTFDHDFYNVVGKQCRTENAYAGHQHNIFI